MKPLTRSILGTASAMRAPIDKKDGFVWLKKGDSF
jgi:hypothetical protein